MHVTSSVLNGKLKKQNSKKKKKCPASPNHANFQTFARTFYLV